MATCTVVNLMINTDLLGINCKSVFNSQFRLKVYRGSCVDLRQVKEE